MIPRHALPQIPKENMVEFKDFLEGNGITAVLIRKPAHEIRPIQKHLNKEKLENILNDPKALSIPLIIDKNGYMLDGHHRWAAHNINNEQKVLCLQCSCGLRELIEIGHMFPKAEIKSIQEYKRNYKKEYKNYHSKSDQKKRRAQRNGARRKMSELGHVHKGDGKDVHHRNRNTKDNSSKNLTAIPKSKNRSMK